MKNNFMSTFAKTILERREKISSSAQVDAIIQVVIGTLLLLRFLEPGPQQIFRNHAKKAENKEDKVSRWANNNPWPKRIVWFSLTFSVGAITTGRGIYKLATRTNVNPVSKT